MNKQNAYLINSSRLYNFLHLLPMCNLPTRQRNRSFAKRSQINYIWNNIRRNVNTRVIQQKNFQSSNWKIDSSKETLKRAICISNAAGFLIWIRFMKKNQDCKKSQAHFLWCDCPGKACSWNVHWTAAHCWNGERSGLMTYKHIISRWKSKWIASCSLFCFGKVYFLDDFDVGSDVVIMFQSRLF